MIDKPLRSRSNLNSRRGSIDENKFKNEKNNTSRHKSKSKVRTRSDKNAADKTGLRQSSINLQSVDQPGTPVSRSPISIPRERPKNAAQEIQLMRERTFRAGQSHTSSI